jgi:hypothetical protein
MTTVLVALIVTGWRVRDWYRATWRTAEDRWLRVRFGFLRRLY